MSFANGKVFAALLVVASWASAAGINTDAAQPIGKGETASVTRLRYRQLQNDIDQYLAQETIVYGVYKRLALLTTLGYEWNRPGESGLQDVTFRGRYTFFFRNRKREALSFAALLGGEIPIGEAPIGTPDGGLLAGVVGTWEKRGWRIDTDAVLTLRPNASDKKRADLSVARILTENDRGFWIAVLELNYERTGDNDVLFLSPGIVYEFFGWKVEASVQINVADDARAPTPDFSVAFVVVHTF